MMVDVDARDETGEFIREKVTSARPAGVCTPGRQCGWPSLPFRVSFSICPHLGRTLESILL